MTFGPVQMLVVGFDTDEFTGKIREELKRLKEQDVVRVIDLLAVRKSQDGELEILQESDLTQDEATEFGALIGALVGFGAGGEEEASIGAIAGANELADGQKIVIAEAAGDDYTLASRISAATGIPTIVGWVGHENQWRGSSEPYAGRFEDVNALYTTTDPGQAMEILEKYGVTYVYVGQFERQQYETSGGLAKFEEMPVMFQAGEVTIYGATGLTGEAEAAQ